MDGVLVNKLLTCDFGFALKVEHEWIEEEKADERYLHQDGSSSLTGNLNMDEYKVTNLGSPTNDNDASNKKYVDQYAQCFLEPQAWSNDSLPENDSKSFTQTINLPDTGDWLVTMSSFIAIDDSQGSPLCYIEIDEYKVSGGAEGIFDEIGASRNQINFNSWQRIVSGKSSFDVHAHFDNTPYNSRVANILFNTTCLKVNKI